MDELYDGFKRDKIIQNFINRMMYYYILSNYFSCEDELKVSIEEKIIQRIPKENLEDILDFSLDEEFAVSFNDFKDGHFAMNNQKEKEILNRLLSFLQNNNLP